MQHSYFPYLKVEKLAFGIGVEVRMMLASKQKMQVIWHAFEDSGRGLVLVEEHQAHDKEWNPSANVRGLLCRVLECEMVSQGNMSVKLLAQEYVVIEHYQKEKRHQFVDMACVVMEDDEWSMAKVPVFDVGQMVMSVFKAHS